MHLCHRKELEEMRIRLQAAEKEISMVTAAMQDLMKRKCKKCEEAEPTVSLAVFEAEQVSNGGEPLVS